jgi:hypothetical protein
VTTDKDIVAVLELNPQLAAPFRLGVYLNDSSDGSHYPRAFCTDAEKDALLAYGSQLKEAGVISDLLGAFRQIIFQPPADDAVREARIVAFEGLDAGILRQIIAAPPQVAEMPLDPLPRAGAE